MVQFNLTLLNKVRVFLHHQVNNVVWSVKKNELCYESTHPTEGMCQLILWDSILLDSYNSLNENNFQSLWLFSNQLIKHQIYQGFMV